MKNKTLSAPSASRTNSSSATPFVQRFTHAAAVRARFPAPPLGTLWDPHLLDRLQAPLTRYRD